MRRGRGSVDDVALGLGEVGKSLAAEEERTDQVDIDWFHEFYTQGANEQRSGGAKERRASETEREREFVLCLGLP